MLRYLVPCALLAIGCSEEVSEEVPCTEQVNGVCVGVENDAGDKAGACPCSAPITEVRSGADLAAALAGAPSCITLAAGHYGGVELHDGFQLVGESAGGVVLEWLSFRDGSSSACRITTTRATVAEGASGTMQYLSIGPSPEDGVLVAAGAEARIIGSTIKRSKRYGVSAFGIRALTIERSLIEGDDWPNGPGVWASCPEGCACTSAPDIAVHDSVVRRTGLVGISLVGVLADMRNVRIQGTLVGQNFDAGIGLSVTQCATVTATGLHVIDNAEAGMCLDGSKVDVYDVHASGNLRGVMLVSASAPGEVHLAGATITNNLGVGLGIGGASFAVVEDAIVEDTNVVALPFLVEGVSAGSVEVGDGVCWNGGAVAHVHRMTVSSSARNAFLINGSASGILEDVTVPDGRIVQINNESGSQPMTSGSTPPIDVLSEDTLCIEDVYPMPSPM